MKSFAPFVKTDTLIETVVEGGSAPGCTVCPRFGWQVLKGLPREFFDVLHGEPVNSHACLQTKDLRALVFRVAGLTLASQLVLRAALRRCASRRMAFTCASSASLIAMQNS
jgi:hypothetical protein